MKIPFYTQETSWTCGPATMRMALQAFGIKKTEKYLVEIMKTNEKKGTDHKYFPVVARKLKLKYLIKTNSNFDEVKKLLEKDWIVIINYFDKKEKEGHYALVLKVMGDKVYLNDPWNKKGKNSCFPITKMDSVWFDMEGEKGWLFAVRK